MVFSVKISGSSQKYELSGKKKYLIGVNFDTETGRISDWQTEEM